MPILDQFGREIKASVRPEARDISVVSIRDRWSTYPSERLSPRRLARIFKQADQGDVYAQSELFEEMEEKDSHLSAELLKRKNAINALDWEIVPYEEGRRGGQRGRGKAVADKACDFCREVIYSLGSFEPALFDLLDAIGKGFAACEITWSTDGGRATIAELRPIPQKKLTFVTDLIPRIRTDANPNGEEIPPWKIVYHRHKARSGYDTRAGMLRVIAWMYLFKNYAVKDWVSFAEIYGVPLRLGKYDPGASKADRDALVAAVRAIGTDAAGIISRATEIEFVQATTTTGRGVSSVHQDLIEWCNKEISKAVVGATLTTDVGSSGSYAASKTHNDVRLDLVKSDSWSLADTLRMQVLRPLVGYNFGWDQPVPWFRFQHIEPEDLVALSQVYKALRSPEVNQPMSAEHVSDRFGIPLPEDGETLLESTARQGNGMIAEVSRWPWPKTIIRAKQPGPGANGDEGPGETLDELGRKTLEATDPDWMMGPVVKLLASVSSLEEFRDGLLELGADMDVSALGDLMQRAFALADLAGRFDATSKP